MEFAGYASCTDIFQQDLLWNLQAMHHARIYSNWSYNGICWLRIMLGYIPTGLAIEFARYASCTDIFIQVLLWNLQAMHHARIYLNRFCYGVCRLSILQKII